MAEDYLRFLQPQVVTKLANMELRARLVVEGFITGLHRSPYHGFSVEFAEHRQYMPGDDLRHIDWKIYGRRDRFYIKRFEEETNLKSYILLDASRSMAFASPGNISKFAYASSLAASLAYMMIKQSDAVGLALYADELQSYLPPHASRSYLRQVLVALHNASPSGGTSTARALHQVADRIRRRGLVIVIGDLLDDQDEVINALKHFRHKKNEVIVMQVLDPLERSFAFREDAEFRDLETGETMVTLPRQIGRPYGEAVARFVERYKRECREHRADYVLMDTRTPFDVALFEYLSKRRRLF